ncbi:hypothetical protein C0J52_08539 [Blattella germanica]|nr:hypothetical protein C0J52_08539 [Blattella germanica]
MRGDAPETWPVSPGRPRQGEDLGHGRGVPGRPRFESRGGASKAPLQRDDNDEAAVSRGVRGEQVRLRGSPARLEPHVARVAGAVRQSGAEALLLPAHDELQGQRGALQAGAGPEPRGAQPARLVFGDPELVGGGQPSARQPGQGVAAAQLLRQLGRHRQERLRPALAARVGVPDPLLGRGHQGPEPQQQLPRAAAGARLQGRDQRLREVPPEAPDAHLPRPLRHASRHREVRSAAEAAPAGGEHPLVKERRRPRRRDQPGPGADSNPGRQTVRAQAHVRQVRQRRVAVPDPGVAAGPVAAAADQPAQATPAQKVRLREDLPRGRVPARGQDAARARVEGHVQRGPHGRRQLLPSPGHAHVRVLHFRPQSQCPSHGAGALPELASCYGGVQPTGIQLHRQPEALQGSAVPYVPEPSFGR